MRIVFILVLCLIYVQSLAQDSTNTSGSITIKKKEPIGLFICHHEIDSLNSRTYYWHLNKNGTVYQVRTNRECGTSELTEDMVFYRYVQVIGRYVYHGGQLRIIASRPSQFFSVGIHYLQLTGSGFMMDHDRVFYLCQ